MEAPQKPRKRRRLFKRNQSTQTSLSEPTNEENPEDSVPSVEEYGDRQRAAARYLEATKLLDEAVKSHASKWGSLEYPELGEPGKFDDNFRHKIDQILEAKRTSFKDQTIWAKCRHAFHCLLAALSPVAKNFLTIASGGQSIPVLNPYGLLCNGLISLITIAQKEVDRKAEFEKTLEFMCQQLEQLDILDSLPDDLAQRESLVNRAMDIRSAFMLYLAAHIQHAVSPFGRIGIVAKTFFAGDGNVVNANECLKTAVDNYSKALHNMHVHISLKAYEVLKGIDARSFESPEARCVEDKFFVPYQQNPRFTGRLTLLQTLKENLIAQVPKQFNHRVALYGMGGVGKTQCALEYVYMNRTIYERVYWITAVNQASLLSGYQKIAKAARLPGLQVGNPSEVAQAVLLWLREDENGWLLIIDNLDDVTVAEGLLPENGLNKHTIITTRNPNTNGIPAEPLEVPLLQPDDAVKLLTTLSLASTPLDDIEMQKAYEIVHELGYLPLAIEQSAAYVQEVSRSFTSFLEVYVRNRRELLKWTPSGNRQYSYSVATTWSMAFEIIQSKHPSSAIPLQLLSFLNPDGILIEFLLSGVEGLDGLLREVISNEIKISKALLELERFSLIKWDRRSRIVVLHRLVQNFVRDQILETDKLHLFTSVVRLCSAAFPEKLSNATRSLCRKYQSQVVEPLLQLETISPESAEIKARIGIFLCDDGKYNESERLFSQALEIDTTALGIENPKTLAIMADLASLYFDERRFTDAMTLHQTVLEQRQRILGDLHPDTLDTLSGIASVYREQGCNKESAKLEEEVLEKSRRALGEDHPTTLTSMHNLAWVYRRQGQPAKAEELEVEALSRRVRIMGDEHTTTFETMHNLALSYYRQGRIPEAMRLGEDVWQKSRKVLGDDHPYSILLMNNLTWKDQDDKNFTAVAQIQETIVQKCKTAFGDQHPETAYWILELGCTYDNLGRSSEALKLKKAAIKIMEKAWGSEHVDTIEAQSSLADTYGYLGDFFTAEKLMQGVLDMKIQQLGTEHPGSLQTMHHLAYLYMDGKRFAEAIDLGEKTLEKRKRVLGDEHPDTLTTMHNLAISYRDQNRIADAIRLGEETREKRKRVLGDEHPDTLGTMHNLAVSYHDQNRIAEAVRLGEETLEKRKRILGDEHHNTLNTMHLLAISYNDQNRVADAIRLGEETLEKRKRVLGDEHPDTLDTMHYLALSYGIKIE